MEEVKVHKAYELLKIRYPRLCLDYVILQVDDRYEGLETHRKAIVAAFGILAQRFSCCEGEMDIEPDAMIATPCGMNELLELPPDPWPAHACGADRSFSAPTPLPYWFAFLEPPHKTAYRTADFIEFNEALFPNRNDTEAYRWNDAFSSYFDAGKEWWGTGLWTAYDRKTALMVVIGASLTD